MESLWKRLLRRPRAGAERERAEVQRGTGPGEGRLDQPGTTGTHRGWGDPQSDEKRELP